ncbi:hypothetical protein [Amycolatopsis pigmentata]|uniref:Uncharacterized protein n=1 Tax=Amycolatopsis pigmentata TaxID=450801 RepID=A0ABW5FPV0_9PSEU
MGGDFRIEVVTDHEYVLHAVAGAETVETWFHLEPEVLRELGVGEADEAKVVARTVDFMAERQSVADFPALVHLEDLIATYADYPEQIRDRLG